MKDIKELLSTPLSTIFLLLGMVVSIFSIDLVCQLMGSELKFYGTMKEFHSNNVSIELGNHKPNKSVLKDIEESYITEPITIGESYSNGTVRIMLLGSNNYTGLERQFKTAGNNYFNEEDYRNGNKVAIIGENLRKLTYKIKGESYIDIQDIRYKIIDYIDNSERRQWIGGAIIPVRSMSDELLNKVGTINIYKESKVESEIDKIKEKLTNIDLVSLEESLAYVLKQVWAYNSGAIKSLSFGILIGILNCIIASLFWSKDIRKNISIKKLLGASKRDIFFDIFYKLFIVNLIAFIISIFMVNTSLETIGSVYMTIIKYKFYYSSIAFIISILISYIITVITLCKTNSFKITEYIR